MDISMKLEGADKLARLFEKAKDAGKDRVLARAMYDEATTVLEESKRLVPVDTGVLRDSGRVESPKADGRGIEVEITYGGAARAYALVVHEDLDATHKDGQTAKYLEKPFMAHKDKYVREVQLRFAEYLRRSS